MSRRDRQFSSVSTEGGLLPQDVLSRIQAGDKDLAGLTPADYHLGPNERIGEAVNRAWSRLTGTWHAFQEALAKEPNFALATGVTRDRWLLPLFEELRYGRLPKGQAIEVEGKSFAVSHTWHHSPIHLLGVGVDLDQRQAGVAGAAKASPHGLVQEFLNRSDEHLWGFVSNGLRLRILRDHHSLTRQAYVEFDLQAIMEGEQYSEFLLLWMVCHQSRVEADRPEDCWLETWFNTSRVEGVRALDKLRGGVEKAIEALGTGFLANRANVKLREALESGELDKQEYYRQLLRLVYRVIFIFVAEERSALLDPDADEMAKSRYLRFYAARRLRDLADKRRGGLHGDLWHGLRFVMSRLDDGCPELALPALGSRLWGTAACPWLMDADCSNEHLLDAVRRLSTIQEGQTRYPVNWRNVGADELGSIYEGLLELHPRMNKEAGTFDLDTAAGHERKTTGSYYTPTELVDCLLDSALDPVLDEASKKPDAETAILDLKVCDPACGSGHFLVAAARRIAKRLAAARAGEDEPSPREVQRAIRDVVGCCVYGVDLNPMAVELCKVSLWMEAIEPGRPLSFLDSHIQCGNALLGTTPALMAHGIPDDAFKALVGDDKKVASNLKKRNKKERKTIENGQATMFGLFDGAAERDTAAITGRARSIEGTSDGDILGLRVKEASWEDLTRSAEFKDAWFRADAWCAAFVWPKHTGELVAAAVTEELWYRLERDASAAPPVVRRTVRELARAHRFFHWHLAFPQVFGGLARIGAAGTIGCVGGFDVVLGNPPWERIKLQEKEFFAAAAPEVAGAQNAAARKKVIARLEIEAPALWSEWKAALREADGSSHLIRASSLYPTTAYGDVNTYGLFAEKMKLLLGEMGISGCIVPPGIVTDKTLNRFFIDVLDAGRLYAFLGFINEKMLFPGVLHNFKFGILVVGGSARPPSKARFAFNLHRVTDLAEDDRVFTVSPEDVRRLNPDSLTCPVFFSRASAELTAVISRSLPLLDAGQNSSGWKPILWTMFHMSNDSRLFSLDPGDRKRPLLEAKMVQQYDHRYSSYEHLGRGERSHMLPPTAESLLADPCYSTTPCYFVSDEEIDAQLADRHPQDWMLVYREVASVGLARTFVATVVPRVGVNHKLPVISFERGSSYRAPWLLAMLNSIIFDFLLRQRLGGASIGLYVLRQTPVVPASVMEGACPWQPDVSCGQWLQSRVLELVYTSWHLAAFGAVFGADRPFRWERTRRFLLQREIDAAMCHLYGLSRSQVEHVCGCFPILAEREMRQLGEYRTKAQILDIYDGMQQALDAREPYQSLLNVPPADPRVAHAGNSRPEWVRERVLASGAMATDVNFLPDGAWVRPILDARGETGAALAAVLKVFRAPTPARSVRLATILALEPRLAVASFDGDERTTWRRLVGAEADALPSGVAAFVPVLDHAWAAAVRHLRGSGMLIEDSAANTWAPGPGLSAIETDGWPDGRARMILSLLRRREEREVVQGLPDTIQRWVDGAAA